MKIIPINLKTANEFILRYHRHCKPVRGCKFCIGAVNDKNSLIGVAIAGRPVNRNLDDGFTLEITRVCTDGTRNVNSFLYARCKRVAQLLGYHHCHTYTLANESGCSMRSLAAAPIKELKGRQWKNHGNSKRTYNFASSQDKIRWQLF